MNSPFHRLYHEQEGQVIILVAALLVGLLGMAALSLDLGFAMHAQRELQASTDAAATAGALDLSNNLSTTTAYQSAYCASGVDNNGFKSAGYASLKCPSGNSYGANSATDLPGVTMVTDSTATYPVAACLSQLTALGLACDNTAGANALAVEEQVTVPTFFGKIFGIKSIPLKAQALAAMKGGTPTPANIMVIVDSTASMATTDNKCASDTGISSPTRRGLLQVWGPDPSHRSRALPWWRNFLRRRLCGGPDHFIDVSGPGPLFGGAIRLQQLWEQFPVELRRAVCGPAHQRAPVFHHCPKRQRLQVHEYDPERRILEPRESGRLDRRQQLQQNRNTAFGIPAEKEPTMPG